MGGTVCSSSGRVSCLSGRSPSRGGAVQPVDRHLGGILFSVVGIIAVVPESS